MLLSAETLWHVELNQETYKTQWYISRGHAILKHCAMLNLIKILTKPNGTFHVVTLFLYHYHTGNGIK